MAASAGKIDKAGLFIPATTIEDEVLFEIYFRGRLVENQGKVEYVGLVDYQELPKKVSFKELQSLAVRKYNHMIGDILYCMHPKDELPSGLHVLRSDEDLQVMINRLYGQENNTLQLYLVKLKDIASSSIVQAETVEVNDGDDVGITLHFSDEGVIIGYKGDGSSSRIGRDGQGTYVPHIDEPVLDELGIDGPRLHELEQNGPGLDGLDHDGPWVSGLDKDGLHLGAELMDVPILLHDGAVVDGSAGSEEGSDEDTLWVPDSEEESESDTEFWEQASLEAERVETPRTDQPEYSNALESTTVEEAYDLEAEELIGDEDGIITPPPSDDEAEDRIRYPEYKADEYVVPEFTVGLQFASAKTLKEALQEHSINKNFALKYKVNQSKKISAHCADENCGWRLYASVTGEQNGMQVKTYYSEHACGRAHKSKQVNPMWICKKFIQMFRDQVLDVGFIQGVIRRKYGFDANHYTVKRGICRMKEIIYGDNAKQFEKLRSYCMTVVSCNPGSTMKIKVDPGFLRPKFERLYLCFKACREGFLNGCRPFFGLDGCHLKGADGGQLLSAIGRDANNGMFPIAMAWVESESKNSWKWFLELLLDDIGTGYGKKGWIVMSDRQKGLVAAVEDCVPGAEHRHCVRHIHANMMSQGWKSKEVKDLLWAAASSYTIHGHNQAMMELSRVKPEAHAYLNQINRTTWTRSHFSTWSKVEVIVNNLNESFNARIMEARDKPIITTFEEIRRKFMREFQLKREAMLRYAHDVCPRIKRKMEHLKLIARNCNVIFAGDQRYEIDLNGRVYVLDLATRVCSCGEYQMTGIPCGHAIAAIFKDNMPLDSYVHECYGRDAFIRAYNGVIYPVPSEEEWPEDNGFLIDPPNPRRQSGRPKTKRTRSEHESNPNPNKLRRQVSMTCTICKGKGHNKRGCPTKKKGSGKGSSSSMGGQNHSEAAQVSQLPPRVSQPSRQSVAQSQPTHSASRAQRPPRVSSSQPSSDMPTRVVSIGRAEGSRQFRSGVQGKDLEKAAGKRPWIP